MDKVDFIGWVVIIMGGGGGIGFVMVECLVWVGVWVVVVDLFLDVV